MARDLRNQVIVITGASSGIGAATAIACAKAGMDVVVSARRRDRLEEVSQQVKQLGRRALPVVCDVSRDEDVDHLIQRTLEEFGRIDVMFANAGVGLIAPVLETSDQGMREMFEINFFGTLRCLRAAVPVMRQATGHPWKGHLLICSSCVSEIGLPKFGGYCATKAAQDSIAQALRAELAGEGIYVSSVHPVTTTTEFFERASEKAPSGGSGTGAHDVVVQTPEHVAKCVVRCLHRPRPEVWPHVPTRFGLAICTAFPRLTAWVIGKMA